MAADTVFVALLRGINVGGRSMLAMADLRRIATDCGFGNVSTYIQSGNLVFTSSDTASAAAKQLRAAIAAEGKVDPRVAIRSRAELEAVVAGNPYLDRSTDAKQLHVAFAVEGVTALEPASADLDRFAPDEVTVAGREMYLFLPDGIGRSKLAEALGRRKDMDATVRNWRTVSKMLALTDI